MRIKLILFLISSLLIIGCSKDIEPIQSTPVNNAPSDDLLKTKIVGQWKCGSSWNFTFYADTTFVDSVSFAVYSPDTARYELWYVVKGKYSINSAVLTFPQMELVFADTSHLLSFNNMEYYIFYPSKVEFINDNLVLNVMDILSPMNGDGTKLGGTWNAENWIIQIERRPNRIASFGTIKKEFQFDEGSHKYNFKSTNLFNSLYQVYNDSGSFTYTTDRLCFGTYTTIPTFSSGRLLLNYISWPVFYYEKVK